MLQNGQLYSMVSYLSQVIQNLLLLLRSVLVIKCYRKETTELIQDDRVHSRPKNLNARLAVYILHDFPLLHKKPEIFVEDGMTLNAMVRHSIFQIY